MKVQEIAVLIIGAGPSGAVAAAYLHHNAIDCKVVEKTVFPRFSIGESLLPRCMNHFEEVDLLQCLEDQNFQTKKGARFIRNEEVCFFDFAEKFTEGWDYTWQVSRADFDVTLTNELQKKGVDISFETEVIDVHFNPDGSSVTTVKNKQGKFTEIHAKFIIDASGYGRVLPKLLNLEAPAAIPEHASIFTHVKDIHRPEGKEGTLITFDVVHQDTWFWVIPLANDLCSIGFVGPIEYLNSFEGTTTEKLRHMITLSDHYKDRFHSLDFEFEPIHFKNLSKSVTKLYDKGFAITGNSAEFLDPVFSSGVTLATESGLLAAKLITRQLKGETVDWELEYAAYMKQGITVFSTYVKEWYTGTLQKIFFNANTDPKVKSQICAVLAGYVWDLENPFVKNHQRLVKTLANFIDLENKKN